MIPQSSTIPLSPSLLETADALKKQYNDVRCVEFIAKIKSVKHGGWIFAQGVCETHGRYYGLAKMLPGGEVEVEFVRVERESNG
jgi:hypothetical protein